MDTLSKIWKADIFNIDKYIVSEGIDPETLSDIDKYIFVSIRKAEDGSLTKFETGLVNADDFTSIMAETKIYPHHQRLFRGIYEIIKRYFHDNGGSDIALYGVTRLNFDEKIKESQDNRILSHFNRNFNDIKDTTDFPKSITHIDFTKK